MKITSIVENTSASNMPVEHGLSLYVERTDDKKVLFDMGQHSLFAENAVRLALSIEDIDVAVVSHGHYDHGGGLRTFLAMNEKADVYLHRDAFLPHYSMRDTLLRYIGLDRDLMNNDRLTMCGDMTQIDGNMLLFAGVAGNCCSPAGNRLLYGPQEDVHDDFRHEQSLIIEEAGNSVLFAGCAHKGIVNIMRRAEEVIGHAPTHVLAGMHLVKSGLNEEDEKTFIKCLADQLRQYRNTMFYTMHCTGEMAFESLRSLLGNQIAYLSCGDSITI